METVRLTVVPSVLKGIVAAVGILGAIALGASAAHLLLLDEAGYGDSYVLYDVLRFQETGFIYRSTSQPPYLPAQYSPLPYMLFAAPGLLIDSTNPFVGPRLLVVSAFLGCLVVVASIAQKLLPGSLRWIWAMLIVASISTMWDWLLQIRADFMGICCSLLAIRFLLSRYRWSVPLAGLFAGAAFQLKITFVAAGVCGVWWLLTARRWRDAVVFSAVASVAALLPYLLYWAREPRMLEQMLALSPGVPDAAGAWVLLLLTAREPVFLLAVLALPALVGRGGPAWRLLLTFSAVSLVLAAVTSIQAGANVNYYFEALLALTPAAVVGVGRLAEGSQRNLYFGCWIVVFVSAFFVVPRAQHFYAEVLASGPSTASRNDQFQRFESVLVRYRTFSTVPRIALIDPDPTLLEPYLLSYLSRLGRANLEPILRSLREAQFDGVITRRTVGRWRGIPHIDRQLHLAIEQSFKPFCTLGGVLIHLPAAGLERGRDLARDIVEIGCQPIDDGSIPEW